MFLNNSLCRFVLVFSLLLFAGCASNETKTANSKDGGVATASTSTGTATNDATSSQSGAATKTTAATKPAVIVANPSIILFDKMSIVLDDRGKAIIPQLAERARSANKLVVTGFCDSRQVGNSTDSAVARAVAVRDELIAQGVSSSKILVKFSTKVAKKHAAEVRFD